MPAALAAALALLAAPAWGLNPDGAGSLYLQATGEVLHPSAQALQQNGGQAGFQQTSAQDWGVGGKAPMREAWSLAFSGSSHQGAWVDSASDTAGGHYDLQGSSQALDMGLSAWLRTGAWFGRDWDPARDHPEGPNGWPVLEPHLLWSQTTESWQLSEVGGISASVPADLASYAVNAGCRLLLPLTRQVAVYADYGESVWSQTDQGSTQNNRTAGEDNWTAGASWILRWRREDPRQAYFPDLGRPGGVRLRAEWTGAWDLQHHAQLSRGLNLSVATPFNDGLALLLGWSSNGSFRAPLDGIGGVVSQSRGPDPQDLFATLTLSFGDAAKP